MLGRSYLEIAAAGGGIARTVRLTRAASDDELAARSAGFLRGCSRSGSRPSSARAATASTARTSSGCCASTAGSLRLSRPAWYPPFSARTSCRRSIGTIARDTSHLLIDDLIPAVARERLARVLRRLRRAVGVHRRGGSPDPAHGGAGRGTRGQAARGSAEHRRWRRAGGGGRSRLGGSSRARLGGRDRRDGAGRGRGGEPPAGLALSRGSRPMPARRLIEAGAAVAVATDFNPGSAPSYHLPFALTLACTLQRMTPAEALKGATDRGGTRGRARGQDRVARGREGRRLRRDRRPRREPLALPPACQRLSSHRRRRFHRLERSRIPPATLTNRSRPPVLPIRQNGCTVVLPT